MVALNDRPSFIKYYCEKHKLDTSDQDQIPESTYILSQEMANIQSGYAKWFNFRHKRFGTVFGRRYTKLLVRSEQELREWIVALNEKHRHWTFTSFWSYVKNFVKRLYHLKEVSVSSSHVYALLKQSGLIVEGKEGSAEAGFSIFLSI